MTLEEMVKNLPGMSVTQQLQWCVNMYRRTGSQELLSLLKGLKAQGPPSKKSHPTQQVSGWGRTHHVDLRVWEEVIKAIKER